jgi:pimeloyl-ACP methyl ester carboxylesterase
MTADNGVLVENRREPVRVADGARNENGEAKGAQVPPTAGFVTSKGGTVISYRQVGHGPALVLLHGTMVAARDFTQLADALAETFTVYTPDRRGRGLSGPYGAGHTMAREVEDLAALLARTGARDVFAVSLGGLIALQAALTLRGIERLAIYEPALLTSGAGWTAGLNRYDREMAEGKIANALVTSLKVTKIGGPMVNMMPRSLLVSMTKKGMAAEDANAQPGEVTMRRLAPTFHYDAKLILGMAGKAESLRGVSAPVLLLGGTKSPRWLRVALDSAAGILPHAERVIFPGLDHSGSTNVSIMNRTGRPDLVAGELKKFFA